jgi:hypothetical protein
MKLLEIFAKYGIACSSIHMKMDFMNSLLKESILSVLFDSSKMSDANDTLRSPEENGASVV